MSTTTREATSGPVGDGRMLSFDVGSHRFDVRAAIVLFNGSDVLLHRAAGDPFWSLPGGRVEAGETAAAAARREMLEELGEVVSVERPMLVIENFFESAGTRHHEIGLYFEGLLRSDSRLLRDAGPFVVRERSRPLGLSFAWFDRRGLDAIDLRPALLREVLTARVDTLVHRVQREA